jgi:two-component system, response regulator PdtaR
MNHVPAVPTANARALQVMVVEDEAINAMLLAEVLEGMGHEVCAIEATESDAVRSAARWRPDLMIVDATLSEGNGISAVATILRSRHIPHLFVSGDISRVAALRPEAVMLQKPFRVADLACAIQQALDTKAVS